MGILVGKRAPTFTTQAVLADGEIVGDYDFGAAIKGKYAVVFFYPMDFTFLFTLGTWLCTGTRWTSISSSN